MSLNNLQEAYTLRFTKDDITIVKYETSAQSSQNTER